jgi:hypothetical protein
VEAVARVAAVLHGVDGVQLTGRSRDGVVRALGPLLAAEQVLVVPVDELVTVEPAGDRGRRVTVRIEWVVYGPSGDSLRMVNHGEWVSDVPGEMVLKSARSIAESDVLCRLFKIPSADQVVDHHDDVPVNRARERRLRPVSPPAVIVPADEAKARIAAAAGGDLDLVDRLWKNRVSASERLVAAMCEQASKEAGPA